MSFKRPLLIGSDDVTARLCQPGLLGAAVNPLITNIATVGAGVLTAAAMLGGVVQRTGPTGAYSDATDTAVNILAAMSGANIGDSTYGYISNQVAFIQTITAGAGVTIVANGTSTVPANSAREFILTVTSATTVQIMLI
jgi:hypothetical protein